MVEGEEWEDGGSLRETIDNLNTSVSHISEIARKIDEGQGTIGQVVNDPGIAEKVEQTLDDTSEIIGGLSRLQTELELRSDYNVPFNKNADIDASIRNTLALRVIPRPDKYYLLEAISDPRGVQTRTVTNTTGTGGEVVTEKVVTDFGGLKFSAQFAKRYYFLTLRFGIIESTGGVGANLHFFDDDLELRLDAFDFSRTDPENQDRVFFPRLRSIAMYEFINHLHLQAGIDDPLNSELRTWFVGGALRFTDDDLKTLLSISGVPSPQ
jgi:phospholipid/cholesterol/gamma-HCH transport system substrate-binding protein